MHRHANVASHHAAGRAKVFRAVETGLTAGQAAFLVISDLDDLEPAGEAVDERTVEETDVKATPLPPLETRILTLMTCVSSSGSGKRRGSVADASRFAASMDFGLGHQ